MEPSDLKWFGPGDRVGDSRPRASVMGSYLRVSLPDTFGLTGKDKVQIGYDGTYLCIRKTDADGYRVQTMKNSGRVSIRMSIRNTGWVLPEFENQELDYITSDHYVIGLLLPEVESE